MEASNSQRNNIFNQSSVHIEPWGPGDLPLLKKLLGDPVMTKYLGGPESDEQLRSRQARYERLTESGKGRVFKIIHEATGEAVGSVSYWDSEHHGENIYEMGWSVLPAFQGQGIASAAVTQAIARARSENKYRFLHAFPSIENPSSNALCQKTGFTLIQQCEFEYPKGNIMQCNDWRIELAPDR
ncbi:MAG TPA: GNAT family N-acetyltransferase [Ktedonobacteraceae bacterium]|nr:GNAT family N-acetyltransferase [Ktedonobacteraceae bacterium]